MVESVKEEPGAVPFVPLDPGADLGGSIDPEGDPCGLQIHSAQKLGPGVVRIHNREASRRDLTEKPSGRRATAHQLVFGDGGICAQVGHHGGIKDNALDSSARQGLGVEFENGPRATAFDHAGEHGGEPIRAGYPRTDGERAQAVGPAASRDQAVPAPRGFENRAEEDGGQRRAGGSRHAYGEKLFGRVAGKGLTEPSQRGTRVGHDDLKPPRLGNGALDDYAGGTSFHRLGDEGVTIVAGSPNRDKYLAGVKSAAIGSAA